MANIRITYHQESDVAYIFLNGDAPRPVDESRICEELGDPVETILDSDQAGRLIGIEVRNAARRLPAGILIDAEPGRPPT
jgi:uncharacterized protein YuzE